MEKNIGDTVKVLYKSYINFPKSRLWNPSTWHNSNGDDDSRIMLGGEYKILAIRNNLAQLLDNDSGVMSLPNLTIIEEVNYCPYKVGQLVRFTPVSSEKESNSIKKLKHYSFDSDQKKYKITEILNNYYIFLDFEKKSSLSYPFRWEDFSA